LSQTNFDCSEEMKIITTWPILTYDSVLVNFATKSANINLRNLYSFINVKTHKMVIQIIQQTLF